ncbi:two-component sensor histidine kinase [Tamilnaduibacter salinus]|uniref:histidine kinase n=1 Tax=Tamilnaduibacter salinus TaxID=1484056 RepID=A0A2A2HYU8_9GAMM|nr:ATP-binding protein [Tamilnaduibacter salinus]PAV24711.1 two-component sensor histidine kinase [Tamilnaduibacter salinus]
MFRSLYTKLAVGLFILLVSVGLVYVFISIVSLQQYNASINQELHRGLAKDLVSDRNLVKEGRLDEQALKALFELYMTINPSIEIYLLDTEGRILSYSADPDKIKRNRVSLAPIRQFLNDPTQYPVLGDDPRSHEREKAFSVTPVPSAENPEGYLYVVLRGEEYDAVQMMAREGQVIRMSAWAVLASLVVGMIAGLLVFRMLTRRLTRLTQLVEAFEHQEDATADRTTWRSQRPHVRDEIDYLGVTFDRMADRIGDQMEQLREKDALRRRLVAQVSHDLRTPLASMQGYVESLRMKRAELSDEEQERFLSIALSEGHRLGHLVNELFELASLEAREKQPCVEPFAPAELVQDVVQKHTPEAAKHGQSLTVTGNRSLPMVRGDLGMTERVLDNLIINAMNYSASGRAIELNLGVQGDRLVVAVNDNGPGISQADLDHVFDPLYRGQSGNDSGHAGLGLAIARRIMELQGGDIDVLNRPQGGASFVVRLPLSD